MIYPFFDPTMALLIPVVILAVWAQNKVKSTYRKYSRIRSASGLTGANVARRILDMNSLNDVEVEPTAGELSDRYDPRSLIVRLSEGIYNKGTIAALGIAAHEVDQARKVLNAAAWTYVAAATMSLMHLVSMFILRSARD